MAYLMTDVAAGGKAALQLQESMGAAPYAAEQAAQAAQAETAVSKFQKLSAESQMADIASKPEYEKQAAQTLQAIFSDPENKDLSESQKMALASSKMIANANGNFKTASMGLALGEKSTLMQQREATTKKAQLQDTSDRLDELKGTIAAAETPQEMLDLARKGLGNPALAMRMAPIIRKIESGAPPEQIRKDLEDVHASFAEKVAYEKFKLLQQTEARKVKEDDAKASRSVRNDALKQAGIESKERISGITSALTFIKLARDSGMRVSETMLKRARVDQETIDYLKEEGQLGDKKPDAQPRDAQAALSVDNKNPLNLMGSDGKLRVFKTYEEGKAAGMQDLAGKLEGTSKSYRDKYGDKPVTPARLAEVWSPAKGEGNTQESTTNYGKAIASSLGISPNEKIDNTPANREKVFAAMERFEGGAAAPSTASTQPVPVALSSDTTNMKLPVAGEEAQQAASKGGVLLPKKQSAATSAINGRLAWGILEGATQAAGDMINIAKMPASSGYNALSGLTSKSGASFTEGMKAMAARKSTPDENRIFEQFVSGFETNMARAMGGGYASSSTKGVMDNYHKQIAIAGDSPIVKAAFLARIKQELGILGKAFAAHPGATTEGIKQFNEMNRQMSENIRFDVSDITTALNSLKAGPQRTQAEAAERLLTGIATKAAARTAAPQTYKDPAEEEAYQAWVRKQRGS